MNAATIFDFANRSGAWTSRFDIWIDFLTFHRVEHMVEVGVFKGEFAERNVTWCAVSALLSHDRSMDSSGRLE